LTLRQTSQPLYRTTRLLAVLATALLLAACQGVVVPGGGQNAPEQRIPPFPQPPVSTDDVQHRTVIRTPAAGASQTAYRSIWHRVQDNLSLYSRYQHASIDNELQWYLKNPRYFNQIIERGTPFLYTIVDAVESRGLPLELALLPIVESAFDPTAYSPEHAAGLWQFIEPTARSFGLKTDWWYDGRQDPLASTRAALDYLETLHREFDGNWLLALAAYNTGGANVRRAVRRSGQTAATADFWQLRLPRETRGHIPRLLAAARLIADAESYGITLPIVPDQPYLEVVELEYQVDLAAAARLVGMEPDLLKTLNAGYRQWVTHPESPQYLVLPRSRAEEFRAIVAGLTTESPALRVSWESYRIRKGDTLSSIARRFNTRVSALQSMNNLRGTRIVAGRALLVPRPGFASGLAANSQPVPSRPGSRLAVPTSYRVRSGDNLWRIARRFNLRSRDIAAWNDIALDSLLHPGQVLILQSRDFVVSNDLVTGENERRVHYSVMRGDSLDRIARLFDVSVEELVAWNQLDPEALIFPGQTIEIVLTSTTLN